jgi:flagellar biosynthesis protein FlhF
MNVRKFIAANARDALRKVKETLGNDAIILSNRGIPGGSRSWPLRRATWR